MTADVIPTRPLGRTGERVTVFGLGGEGVLRTRGRAAEAVAVVHKALDLGVNYVDSAPAYAGCLDYLGEALPGRRGGLFLASKAGALGGRQCERSIKFLTTKTIRL